MFKKIFLLFALMHAAGCFSQNEPVIAKSGIITTDSNQKITFNNLRLGVNQFLFFEVSSGSEKTIATKNIKYVENDRMTRVFSNKKVIDSTEAIDSRQKEIQKQIDRENYAKKEVERKNAEEALTNAKAFDLYPVGIYKTIDDFLNKTPTSNTKLVPKDLTGLEKETLYGTPDHCFFFDAAADKRIRNVFAVVYRGELYFQLRGILKNKSEGDGSQDNEQPNSFARVMFGGDHYYYLEANIGNAFSKAFGASVGGGVGVAMSYSGRDIEKGLVWDIKHKEFNIFKNCKDYNEFIKPFNAADVQDCKGNNLNLEKIRQAIAKIK